ncbi:hypothetical protein BH11PSE11_BH11PSE11_04950 [soil metagenome]
MATNAATTYLRYANLQMAAESLFGVLPNDPAGIVKDSTSMTNLSLTDGNNRSSKFPTVLAQQFLDDGWRVVEHKSNTATGFSGTLFRNSNTNELVLSIRSTEFIDDGVRDSAASNKEIFNGGFAFGQLADLEAWYDTLNADPAKLGGKNFTVTGYSLGGHLATAFNLLHETEGRITSTYTFNGAGVGRVVTGTLRDALDVFRNNKSDNTNLFTDIVARQLYMDMKARMASATLSGTDIGNERAKVSNAIFVAGNSQSNAIRVAELRKLDKALGRVAEVYEEMQRINAGISSGSNADPAKQVYLSSIDAVRLDYQLAIVRAQERTVAGPVTNFSERAPNPRTLPNFFDIYGNTDVARWSAVSNSQYHYGKATPVVIEDQPLHRGTALSSAVWSLGPRVEPGFSKNDFGDTHSLVLVVDSLSVQNAFALLDSNFTAGTFVQIFKAASNKKKEELFGTQGKAEGDVLENIVNGLADTFGLNWKDTQRLKGNPTGGTWATIDPSPDVDPNYSYRNVFYTKLKDVQDKIKALSLNDKIKIVAAPTTPVVRADTLNNLGSVLSLKYLTPFMLKAVDTSALALLEGGNQTVAAHVNEDRQDTEAKARNGMLHFSDAYLTDRAEMLRWLTTRNQQNIADNKAIENGGSSEKLRFQDLTRDIIIDLKPSTSTTLQRYTIFGKDENIADTINGGDKNDRLYGGEGNDVIDGKEGDDYLEGNDGADNLNGGERDDTLIGGYGNDTLKGGDGNWSDTLMGGAGDDWLEGGAGVDTYIINKGDGHDTIVDNGFNYVFYDGKLFAGTFIQNKTTGVYEFFDKDGSNNGKPLEFHSPGVLTLDESSGTKITFQNQTSGEAFANVDFGFHLYKPFDDPQSTVIGDDGDNALGNAQGRARIQGMGGRDQITGGGADDILEGGAGFDVIKGMAGNDRLYTNNEITLAQAIDQGRTQTGTGIQGGWLNGGDGDDTIIGGADKAASYGAHGKDIIVGGAGNDWLDGDDDYVLTGFAWNVIDTGNPFDPLIGPVVVDSPQAGAADVLYGGEGNDSIGGHFGDDILYGEAGNDVMAGDDDNDILYGGDGDDKMTGDYGKLAYDSGYSVIIQGSDYLDGGAGNDWMQGEAGDDKLYGGVGNDELFGDAVTYFEQTATGDDYLNGEEGDDKLRGQSGSDQLFGGDGKDQLFGDDDDTPLAQQGDDHLYGEKGDDLLQGGGGNDELYGGEDNDTLYGEKGNDYLDGEAGDDTIEGGEGKNALMGGEGKDELSGGDDSDFLDGGAGDDKLWSKEGDDSLEGGEGNDQLSAGTGKDHLAGGAGNDSLWGGDDDDSIDGDDGNDYLDGGDGVDQMAAGGGNDVMFGGVGDDTLDGGDGNDSLDGGAGKDMLSGGGGDDRIVADEGDDVLDGGDGTNYLDGGNGNDTYLVDESASLAPPPDGTIPTARTVINDIGGTNKIVLNGSASNTVVVRTMSGLGGVADLGLQIGQDTLVINGGLQRGVVSSLEFGDGHILTRRDIMALAPSLTIHGSTGSDDILGSGKDDVLNGLVGDDTIEGGAGDDLLYGYDGNDTYRFELGFGKDLISNTSVDAGSTIDTVEFGSGIASANVLLSRSAGDLMINVGSSDQIKVVSYFNADGLSTIDRIKFADSSIWNQAEIEARLTVAVATNGPDALISIGPNVPVHGLDGNDTITGLAGDDQLFGDGADDTLYGNDGNDALNGGIGMDSLYGGNGNDTIDGGGGAALDWLYGGAGNDTFLMGRNSGRVILAKDSNSSGDSDTILMASDIRPSDVIVTRRPEGEGYDDLWLEIKNNGSNASDLTLLKVQDYFGRLQKNLNLEQVKFADGTIWNAATIKAMVTTPTEGNDLILGYVWDDTLNGLGGNDTLAGAEGNDTLTGGAGNDLLVGGPGNDTYVIGRGDGEDTVNNYDTVVGRINSIRLKDDVLPSAVALYRHGDELVLVIDGSPTQMWVAKAFDASGDYRIDQIQFKNGTIWSATDIAAKVIGGPANAMTGTAGNDSFTVDNVMDTVTESPNQGIDTVYSSVSYTLGQNLSHTLGDNIENLTLTGVLNINGSGNDLNNVERGNTGNNGLGDLFRDGGFDTLIGGAGDDIYYVDSSDQVQEMTGEGNDTIVSRFSYELPANVENLTIVSGSIYVVTAKGNALDNVLTGPEEIREYIFDGGAGADTMISQLGGTFYIDNIGDRIIAGGPGSQFSAIFPNLNVYSSIDYALPEVADGNIHLLGNSAIRATGNAQANILDGAANAAANILEGGNGNDTYLVGVGDTIIEQLNGGLDTQIVLAGSQDDNLVDRSPHPFYKLAANVENMIVSLGAKKGVVDLEGSDGANILTGNGGSNVIRGMGGDDTIDGGWDSSTSGLQITNKSDLLDGGSGNDRIDSSSVYGSVMIGGTGNDTISGSGKEDTYVFARGDGQDLILDRSATIGAFNFPVTSTDTLDFIGDLTANDVLLSRSGDDLVASIRGTSDSVTVQKHFLADTATVSNRIDQIRFSGGIVWDTAKIEARIASNNSIVATEGADFLVGTGGVDNLQALGGNDYVMTGNGNDTLDGGAGDDTLVGGADVDTYRFGRGSGADTVIDPMTFDTAGDFQTDIILMAADLTPGQITAKASGANSLDLTLNIVGDTAQLILRDFYARDASYGGAKLVKFADGTIWDNIKLADLADSITGTAGADTLTGTAGADKLFGLAGNDTLNGQTGDDRLDGGAGSDTLNGGDGNDIYIVDNTGDVINEAGTADSGIDYVESSVSLTLAANVDGLTLTGNAAINGTGNGLNNDMIGNDAANLLDGGAGDDYLYGGLGNDTLIGGLGSDTYGFNLGEGQDQIDNTASDNSTAIDTLYLGDAVRANVVLNRVGDELIVKISATDSVTVKDYYLTTSNKKIDQIQFDDNTIWNQATIAQRVVTISSATAGADTLTGTAGNDTIHGLAGNDTISGGNGDDQLFGDADIDTLNGDAGNDTLDGGTGADKLLGGVGNDLYIVDNAGDLITENASAGTDTVQSSVTHTLATNVENLTLTGSAVINGTGNTVANILTGNSANNVLDGGAGIDSMAGGLGDDTYIVDNAGDVVTENLNEGIDTVQASVTATLAANVDNLILTGSSAINGTGNALDNALTGNSGANTLTGGGGNDKLDGGTGIDTMKGGAGDDSYTIDNAGDVVTEIAGEGMDTIQSSITRILDANVEALTLTGSNAINGTGNTGDNLIKGNAANNTLDGKAGTDILQGGAGIDTLTDTTAGNNLLDGGAGADILTGGTGKEFIIGGIGNDTITTATGVDVIAFNRGDGQDIVNASTTKDNTLSLGKGITYADLQFKKNANDLILVTGSSEQITFKDWYASVNNHSVANLQLVIEGTTDYNAASTNKLNNKKIEQFDFDGLVTKFDQARAATPSITSWGLSSSMLSFYLNSSDTAAIGGDLAYQYAKNGNLSNVSMNPAIALLAGATFGANQNLQASAALQDLSPRLI